jgi:hypothetical protein
MAVGMMGQFFQSDVLNGFETDKRMVGDGVADIETDSGWEVADEVTDGEADRRMVGVADIETDSGWEVMDGVDVRMGTSFVPHEDDNKHAVAIHINNCFIWESISTKLRRG